MRSIRTPSRSRGITSRNYSRMSSYRPRDRSSISSRLRSGLSSSYSGRSGSVGNSRSKGLSSSLRNRLSSKSSLGSLSERSTHHIGTDEAVTHRSGLSGNYSGIGDYIGSRSSLTRPHDSSYGSRSGRINREVKLYQGISPETGRGIFTDISSSRFARKLKGLRSKAQARDNSSDDTPRARTVRGIGKNRDDSMVEMSGRNVDGGGNKNREVKIDSSSKNRKKVEDTSLAPNTESGKRRDVSGGRIKRAISGIRKKSPSLRKQITENSKSALNRLKHPRRTTRKRIGTIKDTDSTEKIRRTSIGRDFGSKKIPALRKHSRVKGQKDRENFLSSKQPSTRQRRFISKNIKGIRGRDRNSRVVYRERNEVVKDIDRHKDIHIYFDRDRKVCRRRIRPGFRFIVSYGYGPYLSYRAVYPYYLRRYVFVNLGGYWPWHYRYRRYYWYGCHPYYWYGYHPIAYELGGDTYNYYTYNYYYDDVATAATTDVPLVDYSSFYEFRRKLAEQAQEPSEPTKADLLFEDAVEAFEMGAYKLSAQLFAKAMELAPDDMILPFAYCQTLFAQEKYSEAAGVLRSVLNRIEPDQKAVFYPRGLYKKDENVLMEQIENLREKSELYSFDADLQLLLGYQLLGIGQLDEAVEPLRLAALDLDNAPAASVLLVVLEELRQQMEQKELSLQLKKEGK